MTPEQVTLVQNSFAKVAPIAETAAALFYSRLFELDPSLRFMFHGDMEEQGRKLMTILQVAVSNLRRIDTIIPAVRALGARHAGYGVKDEHYDIVASALLWTLEMGLGEDFTADTRDAWVAVYTALEPTMKEAAAEAQYHSQRELVAAIV